VIDDSAGRNPVEVLAEEFLARERRGERPSLTEYVDRYPELADEIHELFPVLLDMEDARQDGDDGPDSAAVPAGHVPGRVGDYRVLREIGRGGMAVVYEAEQESLGRRVALKVLARTALTPQQVRRFEREARSAAGLHHTNIVPVFGVGREGNVHYYVMQYIPGQPLDQVLKEVRRLRRRNHRPGRELAAATVDRALDRPSAGQVALSLWSGRGITPVIDHGPEGRSSIEGRASDLTLPDRTAQNEAPTPDPPIDLAGPPIPTSSHSDVLSSSVDLTGSGSRYARAIARIGAQVADALEYAAEQGIIHRDVKPSNILLDLGGTAWVTDFGLAKVAGLEDLTHSGDLVGTLRYMAPERFRGQADRRSDVYALGLTLYELLALRPAYNESDRVRLIRQVTHEEAPRLSKHDPAIPRDLATIVHKATAREPAERYATAALMATDLRRFLEDRPIAARRPSPLDRAAKWSRRHKAVVATAAAALVLLLAAVSVVASVAAFWLRDERNATFNQLAETRKAQKEGVQRLYEAKLAEAKASRWSGRAGRRLEGLGALTEAAGLAGQLTLSPDSILTLRNESIACMALVDLRLDQKRPGYPPGSTLTGIAFDREMNRYARVHEDGYITVRRFADDQETVRIDDLCAPRGAQPSTDWRNTLRFSPDGRYLAAAGRPDIPIPLQIWDLSGPRSVLRAAPAGGFEQAIDFSPDSRILAARGPDQSSIRLFDVRTANALNPISLGGSILCLRFHPRGDRIAVALGSEVRVVDLGGRPTMPPLVHQRRTSAMSWSGDGRLLATSCDNGGAYVWDVRTGKLQAACLRAFSHEVSHAALNERGDLLVSVTDGTTLWDPRSGRELLQTTSLASEFSQDDRWLGLGVFGPEVGRWEVGGNEEYRLLGGHPPDSPINSLSATPDGRLLASAAGDGVRLWDLAAGKEVALLPSGPTASVIFDAHGRFLITSGSAGLFRWPIRTALEARSARFQLGPPEPIRLPMASDLARDASLSADARTLAVRMATGTIEVLDLERPFETPRTINHSNTSAGLSADGRWLATSVADHFDTQLWDSRTGKWLREFPGIRTAPVAFSPDNRWLVFATAQAYITYQVDSWQPGPRWPRDYAGYNPCPPAFAAGGKTVAIAYSSREIKLLEPDTVLELATLAAPVPEQLRSLCFTSDGGWLAAGSDSGAIQLWDLHRIRRHLREMRLDWDPPAQPSQPTAGVKPVQVDLRLGELSYPEKFSLILAFCPFDGEAYFQRGLAYARRERYPESVDDFRRALALKPDHAEAHYQRALVRRRQGKPLEALTDLGRTIALAPNHAGAHRARGMIHFAARDWTKSAEDLARAADLTPDWPELHNQAAWLLATHPVRERRDAGRAVALAQKAVELDPNEHTYWNTLGVARYRAGQWNDAIEALTRSTDLAHGQYEGFDTFVLAMAHWQLGNKQKARTLYASARRWMEKNMSSDEELRRFADEAAAVLRIDTPSKPAKTDRLR